MPEDSLNHFDTEVEKLLQHVAEDEGLLDYKMKKSSGSMKGDGYLGVITAIEMSGTTGSEMKVLDLVVKTASKSDALRVEAPIADVFQREIYMYNTVIPAFRKFQSEVGVPPTSSFAKCYKATIIDKSEALVLENLKSNGYKLWERRIPMNEEYVALVMREYGRFHAISLALKDQNPEEFRKLTKPMSDVFAKFLEKATFNQMFVNQCQKACEALDPLADADAIKVFKSFMDHLEDFLKCLPEMTDYYSVILHGDCWTNNMMFQYNDCKKPDTPTNVCFIDLQLSRLGPPVFDLSYFFYACSSKNVITDFQKYLDIYYNSLSDYLKQLGSNPEDVYPYSVFRRQWKESARFGLLMSMFLIKIMLSEQNEVVDISAAAESGSVGDAFDYNISKSDEYSDRVKHVILHFVNNRFI